MPLNTEVILPLEQAFRSSAGIAVLSGNLAPDSCVVKAAGLSESMMVYCGPARCFDSEEYALLTVEVGHVQQGGVLVMRYQGPRSAPDTPKMLGVMIALKSRDGGLIALVGGVILSRSIFLRGAFTLRCKTLLLNSGANTGQRVKSRQSMVFCGATANLCGGLAKVRFWISRLRQRI